MKSQQKANSLQGARSRKSAGLLFFRETSSGAEVFLVHPGGSFWAKKDDGVWSIPKGEFLEVEEPLAAAKREFEEETGLPPSAMDGKFEPLQSVRQPSGKMVYAWAVRGDIDASSIRSNTFSIELPKGSGKLREFPEVDRAAWFSLPEARRKILRGQAPLLDQLEEMLRDK